MKALHCGGLYVSPVPIIAPKFVDLAKVAIVKNDLTKSWKSHGEMERYAEGKNYN
jgi:hypothetical protein